MSNILDMASKDVHREIKKNKKNKKKMQGDPNISYDNQENEQINKIAFIQGAIIGKALNKFSPGAANLAAKGMGAIQVGSQVGLETSNLKQMRDNAIGPNKLKPKKYAQPLKIPQSPKSPQGPDMSKNSSLLFAKKAHIKMLELEKKANSFTTGIQQGLGLAAATAGTAAVVHGASKLHKNIKAENMWKALSKRRPDLTRTRKDRENFEVLKQFSPDLATNITTLESYMERMKHQMMTPHEFIGDLTNIQKDRGMLSNVNDFAESTSRSVGKGLEMAYSQRGEK